MSQTKRKPSHHVTTVSEEYDHHALLKLQKTLKITTQKHKTSI